ncbi:MAG: transcriptional repressor LexA [Candidatus Dojkabacteria bacterium]
MTVSLSKRQKEVFDKLSLYIEANGESPTLAELMGILNISTKKGVAFHLDALEKKGYIYRTGGTRGITLVAKESEGFVSIPILGFANAGQPLVLAEEDNLGEVMVDKKLIKPNRKVFGLEIKGDSMNRRMINGIPLANGNYVLVAQNVEVHDGDVVLAVIEDAATIKTIKHEKNMVVLYPESTNPNHKPIYISSRDNSFINGKVLTALSNPSI